MGRSLFGVAMWRGRSRWTRLLRALVAAVAIAGTTPGSMELLETLAHLVHDGQTPQGEAHADADRGPCGDDCGEDGCTPLHHVCGCCGLAADNDEAPALEPRVAGYAAEPRATDDFDGPERAVPPPVPPPIA